MVAHFSSSSYIMDGRRTTALSPELRTSYLYKHLSNILGQSVPIIGFNIRHRFIHDLTVGTIDPPVA